MGLHRGKWLAPIAAAAAAGLVMAGCTSGTTAATTTTTSASSGTTAPAGGGSAAPGVTATSVSIGTISSRTGVLAGYFAQYSNGMIAYFDMIDAQGGVNGRKINLAYNLDDGGSPSQFTQLTHTLIDQDHVFAVGTASYWFTPGYFAQTHTPTYGYNVTGNWSPYPNLFASGGSVQDYSSATPTYAYFAKTTHSKSLAFISYGPAIASSYNACHTTAKELQAAGIKVSFVDVGAQLGGSFSSDVQRLQQSGSDAIISCMQASDNITLSRDIQQYGLKIKQLWLNGYDQTLLSQYSSLMQGVYFNNAGNLPFATASLPSVYPGMKAYVTAMDKYEPQFTNSNVALAGWQSGALLVAGIRAAGKNLTQAAVVAATNKLTADTAAGTQSNTNWTVLHVKVTYPSCSAWVQVKGSTFASVFAPGHQAFICVGPNPKNPVPLAAPAGTPGA
jgi:branched-chain amino acid transport system substrate-binding protein